MGIQNLSPDTRGFLYTFFNEVSSIFAVTGQEISEPQQTRTARILSIEFRKAAFLARKGDLPRLNSQIDSLIQQVKSLQDPPFLDAMQDVHLWQALMFGNTQVRPETQKELGSYSKGIF